MADRVLARLGRRVRNLRQALDWSQEDLAAKSGLHRTYIGSIERGERNVALLNLVVLARSLRVSLPGLLKGVAS
jgi:transcriptional regulator with XRE-family HTH domain